MATFPRTSWLSCALVTKEEATTLVKWAGAQSCSKSSSSLTHKLSRAHPRAHTLAKR